MALLAGSLAIEYIHDESKQVMHFVSKINCCFLLKRKPTRHKQIAARKTTDFPNTKPLALFHLSH